MNEGGLKAYDGWGSDGLGKLIVKFYANTKEKSKKKITVTKF